MITLKRSCSSSIREFPNDKYVFADFTIIIDKHHYDHFKDIAEFNNPEPDKMPSSEFIKRTLEDIIDSGIYHMSENVYDEIEPKRMVNE